MVQLCSRATHSFAEGGRQRDPASNSPQPVNKLQTRHDVESVGIHAVCQWPTTVSLSLFPCILLDEPTEKYIEIKRNNNIAAVAVLTSCPSLASRNKPNTATCLLPQHINLVASGVYLALISYQCRCIFRTGLARR